MTKGCTYTRLMPMLNTCFSDEAYPFDLNEVSLPSKRLGIQSLSSLLALILLVNTIGYYPLFKLNQWQSREERIERMVHSLSLEELQKISVTLETAGQLSWQWEDNEFRYQGQLYDIIKVRQEGATTHYYCINDTDETVLEAQLQEDSKDQFDDKQNPFRHTVKKIMKTVSYFESYVLDSSSSPIATFLKKQINRPAVDYSFFFFSLHTPPPEV